MVRWMNELWGGGGGGGAEQGEGCRTDGGEMRRGKSVLTSDLCKPGLYCFHLTRLNCVAVLVLFFVFFLLVTLLLHVFTAVPFIKKYYKQIKRYKL